MVNTWQYQIRQHNPVFLSSRSIINLGLCVNFKIVLVL